MPRVTQLVTQSGARMEASAVQLQSLEAGGVNK